MARDEEHGVYGEDNEVSKNTEEEMYGGQISQEKRKEVAERKSKS